MLIEFQVENFRSFRERQVFSMVAGHFAEHRDTNTFPSVKGFGPLVRSAVIYGPNASGKTNLLLAMNFMKNFVTSSAAATATSYPFTPFKLSKKCAARPSCFQAAFIQGDMRYEYGFSMAAERIQKEWLVEHAHVGTRARGRTLFERTWSSKTKNFEWKFSNFLKGQKDVWAKATRANALFLSTAIQLNSTQLQPVFDWFQKKLVVIVGPVTLNESLTLALLDRPDGREKLLPFLHEADLGISDVQVKKEPIPASGALILGGARMVQAHNNAAHLVTVTMSHVADNEEGIGIDLSEESTGTQLLFKTAGAWLNVLANGEILVLDEIDSNMHPALLKFLIDKFHSSKANPHNAQLICSTHNTSILQKSMFRRDQIWFAEKGRDGASNVYPLTDFNPRNDESFERAYMRGQYGAQPILPSNAD